MTRRTYASPRLRSSHLRAFRQHPFVKDRREDVLANRTKKITCLRASASRALRCTFPSDCVQVFEAGIQIRDNLMDCSPEVT